MLLQLSRAAIRTGCQSQKRIRQTSVKYDWLATYSQLRKAKWLTESYDEHNYNRFSFTSLLMENVPS